MLHSSKLGIVVKFQFMKSVRLVKKAFPETVMKDEKGLAWTWPAGVKRRGVCMESLS